MNILFITPGIEDAAFGGPKGSIRNYKALKKYGNVEVYTFKRKSALNSMLSLLTGYYPPLDHTDYKRLKNIYNQYRFDIVFFDTSIYGKIIDIFSNSKSVVFCHNCEYDYNNAVRFGRNNSVKKRMYLKAIFKNEGYLLYKAKYRITFTKRDSDRLNTVYGVKTDLIIPLGIEDNIIDPKKINKKGEYCLLFGAYGAANVEGYEWFVKNISPKLICKTVVAGKGFEVFKDEWTCENVEVYGFVEDMEKLYENALFVAVPLLSGGGMKVKVVEALMYGKEVFGTDEAFEGFDIENLDCMHRCNTVEEYITEINSFIKNNGGGYNGMSRQIYENNYSLKNTCKLFDKMISDLELEI